MMVFLYGFTCIYALAKGEKVLSASGFDVDRNILWNFLDNACGLGKAENYPLIFFIDPTFSADKKSNNFWKTVCVADCSNYRDCYVNSLVSNCEDIPA